MSSWIVSSSSERKSQPPGHHPQPFLPSSATARGVPKAPKSAGREIKAAQRTPTPPFFPFCSRPTPAHPNLDQDQMHSRKPGPGKLFAEQENSELPVVSPGDLGALHRPACASPAAAQTQLGSCWWQTGKFQQQCAKFWEPTQTLALWGGPDDLVGAPGGVTPAHGDPKSLQQPAMVTSEQPKEHSSGWGPNFLKEQQFLEGFSCLNAS